ncbi:MAG: FAD-binding oxidoreductase [Myxococcaceae bacterium]
MRRQGLAAAGVMLGAAAGAALAGSSWSRRERREVWSETLPTWACAGLHALKVERIARRLRERTGTAPLSLRKRAVKHEVPKAGDARRRDEKIDISELNGIIDIDPVARVATAESGVSFFDLVAATLRHGLVPLVVPELKTITVGGAVSGCSIESMSFQVGGFHDTCLEYEVITSGGEVLNCTPDNEHRLVFEMMHGSFGTLGILSRLKFRLVPARPYVKVSYERHHSFAEYLAAIEQHTRDRDVDFMDGFIDSPTDAVLNLGRFVDEAPYLHRYDWIRAYPESTRRRSEDYLRTADYFYRYDRGVARTRPRSLMARLLFGKLTGSSQVLRAAEKLHRVLPAQRPTIVLDVFVPLSRASEFMRWYASTFCYFPLWCVPYRAKPYPWLSDEFRRRLKDGLFLDLAIYGMKQGGEVNYHALMEQKLLEIGGLKTLIAHNYFSEEDFWRIWNRENYAKVKRITDPKNVFRDLYTKTCRAARGLPG